MQSIKKFFGGSNYQQVELASLEPPNAQNDREAERQTRRSITAKEDEANIFSKLFFWWVQSTVSFGSKQPLKREDLGQFPSKHHTEVVDEHFQQLMADSIAEYAKSKSDKEKHPSEQEKEQSDAPLIDASKQPSLLTRVRNFVSMPLLRSFWKLERSGILLGFFLKLFGFVCSVSSPMVMRSLLQFLQLEASGDHQDLSTGIGLAVALFVLSFGNAYAHQHLYWIGFKTGTNYRSGIMTAVYRKLLRLSPTEKRTTSSGQLMNLVSVDSQRVMNFIWNPHDWWSGPVAILINLGILFWLVGYSALPGVFFLFLMGGPINWYLTRLAVRFEERLIGIADDRINHVNEILLGIKFLKLYNWEDCFKDRTNLVREIELEMLRKIAYVRAVANFMWTVMPATVSLLTFILFSVTGGNLQPSLAFTIVAIVNNIREPMVKLFGCIFEMAQAFIATRRINEFLNLDEVEIPERVEDPEFAVNINGDFAWEKNSALTLEKLKLRIPYGKLYIVVGPVGCGKTSLLSAILGEIKKVNGDIYINGTTISTTQTAWLLNATLRENILFGKPFDQKKYETVVKRCALQRDIDGFPAGDQTEIGERGVNLSGGQKQRVALARALYRDDADIFLFDEPLGAVDSTVANWIFHECMVDHLKHKTRILVTHQLQFLPFADCIIVMQNGTIKHQGSYTELMNEGVELSVIVKSHTEKLQRIRSASKLVQSAEPESDQEKQDTDKLTASPSRKLRDDLKKSTIAKVQELTEEPPKKEENKKVAGKLTQEEESDSGPIGRKMYLKYFSAGGTPIFILVIFLYIISQMARIGQDYWLVWWTSGYIQPDPGLSFYIGIYATWYLGASSLVLARELFLAYVCIRCAKSLHSSMLECMLRAPMNFFDSTPIGRILNRFSKDQTAVDEYLAPILSDVGNFGMVVISVIILICILIPVLVIPMVAIAIMYFFVQRYYSRTARELKQMDSISRSPIFSYFSETVNGSTTIRCYRRQDAFLKEFSNRVDDNVLAYYWHFAVNRWLGVRLELVSALVVLATASITVTSAHLGVLSTGLAGMSLSYALSLTGILNWFVRQYTDMEIQMTSVGRIIAYTEIAPEAPLIIPNNRTPPHWPEKGDIDFKQLFVRYTQGAEHVLKGITCAIKSNEKIGIVGRTGAGKSSLTASLFRLLEASSGGIIIDGVEIGSIGLSDLRSNISIIPQDPLLFSGTIRFNLDPLGLYTDAEIWDSLSQVNLKSVVQALPQKLDTEISENAENFSLGQRQLFSLCRVLLKRSKILILDEATASLDLETDEFIQTTVREQFADSTVLTIAHRLDTVIDSSRIMVLDKGELKEFDTPQVLLSNPESLFSALVDSTLLATQQNSAKHNL